MTVVLPFTTTTEKRIADGQTPVPYAEFGMRSSFSFLEGASRPEEMVVAAGALGFAAAGLADRNTVAGTVRAWNQAKVPCKEEVAPLPFHPGARLVFSDGTPDVLAYPRSRTGWAHLCRMLTAANFRGEKGAPDLQRDDLFEWGAEMSLAVLADPVRGRAHLSFLRDLRASFPGAVRLGVAPLYGDGGDTVRFAQADALARAARVPLMALSDALVHTPARRPLQDVMTAIRLKTTVARAGRALEANATRTLRSGVFMARLFHHHPEAIRETLSFAGELSFSFSELHHNYPDETGPNGESAQAELERLTWEGAVKRWPEGVPDKHAATIRHEFALIRDQDYARYFLTVHDIMRYARDEENILCQGRGSAANSVVCYCLKITDVSPDLGTCLFERFISRERNEPPDIDVDFEHERRDLVMTYIARKYQEKHTALACAVISFRPRSALREVGKALGFTDDALSALSGATWRWKGAELDETEAGGAGMALRDPATSRLFALANSLIQHPRHLSQHVGGFVITKDRLDEIVPIVKTGMDSRKMVEWDKDDLDSVKLLKVDILALGMLSCLQRCFGLLKAHYGMDLDLAAIAHRTSEEATVYAMIQRADTLGVFQIESRAQMTMLPRLRPREFYDLVIEVAIVRPGPIQGDMVHPYLRRRQRLEKAEYPKPELEAILKKTLGVPLFQEQIMQIAIHAAGFEPGEADQLRRSMATFKRTGTMNTHGVRFIEGMVGNGYKRDFAERCFRQVQGFAEYGFPESHAASFALLVYASCWFKALYPDVFCAGLLNAQPMGFYAPAQVVRDAREHGVEVRAVDVNHSDWDCTLEEAGLPTPLHPRHVEMAATIRARRAVRLGFRQVKGLAQADMDRVVRLRGAGYRGVRDLWRRTGLDAGAITRLAEADAFRSLGLDRRAALWEAQALLGSGAVEALPLFEGASGRTPLQDEPQALLPLMTAGEHVVQDYRALSLSLKAHPVSFLRARLRASRALCAGDLERQANNSAVRVAGLVLVRQRPGSAKGVIFLTAEDETGVANVVVWPKCFEAHRAAVLGARLVGVVGRVQKQGPVVHVVAERVEDLSGWLDLLSHEGSSLVDGRARADEVNGAVGAWRKGSGGGAQGVMPKGRNFH